MKFPPPNLSRGIVGFFLLLLDFFYIDGSLKLDDYLTYLPLSFFRASNLN